MRARRSRVQSGVALALVAGGLWLAGCGSSDDGVSPGPPTDYAEAEPNDFTAQSLGALDSTDITVGGQATGDTDVDLYQVTLTDPGGLYVQLDWSGGQDLLFAVSNEQGVFVSASDGPGHPEICYLTGLAAGDHLIRIGSHTASSVNYVLTIGPR